VTSAATRGFAAPISGAPRAEGQPAAIDGLTGNACLHCASCRQACSKLILFFM
jgi:hypothetical protein